MSRRYVDALYDQHVILTTLDKWPRSAVALVGEADVLTDRLRIPDHLVGRLRNPERRGDDGRLLTPRLLVGGDDRWHRASDVFEVNEPSAGFIVRTKCGRWLEAPDETDADPDLCHKCWPMIDVGLVEPLGHLVQLTERHLADREMTATATAYDVERGAVAGYRVSLELELPPVIEPEPDVWLAGAFAAHTRRVRILGLDVAADDEAALHRMAKVACLTKSFRYITDSVKEFVSTSQSLVGISGAVEAPVFEIGPGRREDDAQRKQQQLKRVAEIVEEHPNDYAARVRTDRVVLELGNRDGLAYSLAYARQLKAEAVKAGLLPVPKPRGRMGGRRNGK
jgi:hypothetical protein